ncbi:baseplate J/gp47 family protein [Bradyrhizobium sp. SRL28]|uniref:baseplate J/gp47 family protein n=1 Tax=Bradyrhizobium sp. SRL28 TaxID=2836178 RepID=UPI001BDF3BAB|nr:baseplate J/gp47 family protein [Bradyrhizobium sp. SRL28]MBT1509398.1 baseplate J/gp47 family protein [Bradyrhizobium sp. SRL28]
MPWSTPTLKEVRGLVRDNIRASLPGADASVPNSVLRVLSDAQGGLCHLTLQYIDWLSLQLLPDTAEGEWLDRHGAIWLVNSDGTIGRKQATFAEGWADFNGDGTNATVPMGTQLVGVQNVSYETTEEIVVGTLPTPANVRALDSGIIGNLEPGTRLGLMSDIPGVTSVVSGLITGGVDTESDDDLRKRILHRIQNPPMGGAQADYVTWALAVPGVTRAWAAPEQGIGTITVRFLMDVLRAADDGWPYPTDVIAVKDYIDLMRPVTVKDSYVVAPIKQFIDVTVMNLVPDTAQGAVEESIRDMLFEKAAPGQTIYAAWISYAIMNAPTVQSFQMTLPTEDYVMPSLGHMAVLGTLLFEETTAFQEAESP